MPRLPINPARLTLLLQVQGALGGRAILDSLGISSATLTRWVAQLGPVIERMGAARSSRYALRRPVRNLGSQWPIYRIGDDGRARVWGELRALHGGFRFVPTETPPGWMPEHPDGLFSGLPFFLQDIRPQGYLGRAIARDAAPRLGVPEDLRRWSDDDALGYFLTDGHDLPGDLVLGDHALERALRSQQEVERIAISNTDRDRVYPDRAAAAQRGELVGSSAGGEQPKFLATVQRAQGQLQPVLVKFSAADASAVSQRWADLLQCEHVAAHTMRQRRIVSASTTVIDAGNRRFLEVERFDRPAATGRRGLITLGTLEDAFLENSSSDWAAAAGMLQAGNWISVEESRLLRWIWCFGSLIANTDMHRANASFWFGDELPWRLTPFYDMLPMLYAPGAQGDLSERSFSPRPPLPGVADVWRAAAAAAEEFWGRVSEDPAVSSGFQRIAAGNLRIVQGLVSRFV